MNSLHKLQKKSLRLVCEDFKPHKHAKTMAVKTTKSQTRTLPLPTLSTYSTCLLGHNILKIKCPLYLTSLSTRPQLQHSLRNHNNLPSSLSHNKLNLHNMQIFNSPPESIRISLPHSIRS